MQLYIRDQVASVTRPVKELKGFQKVFLKQGEQKSISFEIDKDVLSFYRPDGSYLCEPGKFTIMVGGSSDHFLKQELEI